MLPNSLATFASSRITEKGNGHCNSIPELLYPTHRRLARFKNGGMGRRHTARDGASAYTPILCSGPLC